jgi:surface-anchored protein
MKTSLKNICAAAVVLFAVGPLAAQPLYLTNQHMDIWCRYDAGAVGSNQLGLVLQYNAPAITTVSNDQFYIVGGASAKKTIPDIPDFAFMGPAGAPIWILPHIQDTTRPYLGISAADSSLAAFDTMRLELVDVQGPGNFTLYDIPDSTPVVILSFSNGVVSPTQYSVDASLNGHAHFNWAFSTNGLYRVTFRGVGSPMGTGTNLVGRDVTFAFQLLPLRPWETWVSTNWPPATLDDIAGPAANPDGDRVLNVMEYALGLNPHELSTNGFPTASLVTTNSQTYGALSFTRVKAATDLVYEPSARSTLTGGDWTVLTNVMTVVDHGATETVTVRDDEPVGTHAARFLQLRVKLNYP